MSEHWLFSVYPDRFEKLRKDNFESFEFPNSRSPRVLALAAKIKTGNRCVIYISERQKLGAICQIISHPCPSDDKKWPLRVKMQPELIPDDEELLDFKKLLQQLSFISLKEKKGNWGAAVASTLHQIPEKKDFQKIESEMKKSGLYKAVKS